MELQFLDAKSGRGIPLVEVESVHNVRHVSDNAGRIALETELLAGETVFFTILAPGYEVPKDGFGIAGVRLELKSGGSRQVKLNRTQPAERMGRLTGRECYRDSLLLGKSAPLALPNGPALVAGQDSVQVVEYGEKLYWFWGDTNQLAYPLGLFRTAGATTPLPGLPGCRPETAIDFTYFKTDNGFARAMAAVEQKQGVVWIDGLCAVPDATGKPRMVCHYSHREGLAKQLGHGFMAWNDAQAKFEVVKTLPNEETWRCLNNHPELQEMEGAKWLVFGEVFPTTRVPATYEAVLEPSKYQGFHRSEPTKPGSWTNHEPTSARDEQRWLKEGKLTQDQCQLLPSGVSLHRGTVRWNANRQRYILIGNAENQKPSYLGEVYYSESTQSTGPFTKAVKIATHPGQTFYNPRQHAFFDEQGGAVVYFEGTYTNTFTSSPPVPRYNYNQLLYRLALSEVQAEFPSQQ
jgi:hypothetical protein